MDQRLQKINRVGRRLVRPLQLRMDQWLVHLSAVRQPGPTRKRILRALSNIRLALILYLEGIPGSIQVWEGESLKTGQRMRVGYLGDQRAVRYHSPLYLQSLLFKPDTVTETQLENISMLSARKHAETLAADCDMVIVDGNGLVLWQPPYGRSTSATIWVRMEFILKPGEGWDEIQRQFRSHKNNLKRIQQNGFQYRISHDAADFELFYDQMYVPLIKNRYGDVGSIDQKESMRAEFKRGFLLMIDDANGQPVAAQLSYIHRTTLYSLSSGVLNGDPEMHAKGALGAIYYYSIKWCHENGIERFEMGGCRPFETDGLYQYKQRWGMTPTPDLWTNRSYLFWVPGNAQPATAWLDANPVISLETYWNGRRTETTRSNEKKELPAAAKVKGS